MSQLLSLNTASRIVKWMTTETHSEKVAQSALDRSVSHSVRSNSDPRAAARQAPLSTGFSRQGCWSRQPCPPPADLPDPGFEPESPTPQADSALSEPPGKPKARWKPPQTPRLSFPYKHGWTVGPASELLPSDVTGGWDHQSGETLVGPPPSADGAQ